MTEPPPPLDEWAQRALHCWNWCEGWNPERWLMYQAFHDVPDWALLIGALESLKTLLKNQDGTGKTVDRPDGQDCVV